MANSGGGMIVYGIAEKDKCATGREDTGELSERLEQTLRSVAVSSIHPPVFGLRIAQLGGDGSRCVVVIVPASTEGPHLIYRGEYFGAPIRNDADTVWMKEREVEKAYRQRFDERRYANEALDRIYNEQAIVTDVDSRGWLIAVGRPRIRASFDTQRTQDDARGLFEAASVLGYTYAPSSGPRPLSTAKLYNPRPGLRRWIALHSSESAAHRREALVGIHHDGAVTVAFALGGLQSGRDTYFADWEYATEVVEAAVADFMALLRVVSERVGSVDYETRIGIERTGPERMMMYSFDDWENAYTAAGPVPIVRFLPVEATVEAGADDARYMHQVQTLIQDCVNQGGVSRLSVTTQCCCSECDTN
jgi:hypothetical protein